MILLFHTTDYWFPTYSVATLPRSFETTSRSDIFALDSRSTSSSGREPDHWRDDLHQSRESPSRIVRDDAQRALLPSSIDPLRSFRSAVTTRALPRLVGHGCSQSGSSLGARFSIGSGVGLAGRGSVAPGRRRAGEPRPDRPCSSCPIVLIELSRGIRQTPVTTRAVPRLEGGMGGQDRSHPPDDPAIALNLLNRPRSTDTGRAPSSHPPRPPCGSSRDRCCPPN